MVSRFDRASNPMKQVTTLLPDPIAQALRSYIGSQNAPLTEDLIINTAIEQFLIRQGFLPTFKKRLILTPEAEGSGYRDTALHHDQAFLDTQNP